QSSRQARLFGDALAEIMRREWTETDLIALQAHWGDTESYRTNLFTVMTRGIGGDVPVTLTLADNLGHHVRGSTDLEVGLHEIPGADLLQLGLSGIEGKLATLTKVDITPYTGTLAATRDGSFDLGVVVPASDGELRHVIFRSLTVTNGEQLVLTVRPR